MPEYDEDWAYEMARQKEIDDEWLKSSSEESQKEN